MIVCKGRIFYIYLADYTDFYFFSPEIFIAPKSSSISA